MKLYDGGVYLVNGSDIVEESKFDQPVSREDAAKNTICLLYTSMSSNSAKKPTLFFSDFTVQTERTASYRQHLT